LLETDIVRKPGQKTSDALASKIADIPAKNHFRVRLFKKIRKKFQKTLDK